MDLRMVGVQHSIVARQWENALHETSPFSASFRMQLHSAAVVLNLLCNQYQMLLN